MTTITICTNDECKALVVLTTSIASAHNYLSDEESRYADIYFQNDKHKSLFINRYDNMIWLVLLDDNSEQNRLLEQCRIQGSQICKQLNDNKINEVSILATYPTDACVLALAEGMALSNYQFLKHKTKSEVNSLQTIAVYGEKIDPSTVNELNITVESVMMARDLVNEPSNFLNATELSEFVSEKITEVGGSAEILNFKKIEALKMGGLLAVNRGSVEAPTFTILEWKPEAAVNAQPLVLVGKGVMFDTGGYNLKSGANMNDMKHDMAGAATVAAVIYGVAKAKLPFYVVALLPATDNRIGDNAQVTGDVLTMSDGTTVEVINTDAEGRLILADALVYAQKYNPMAVLDFATLTGAAARAIGPFATPVMQVKADNMVEHLQRVGFEVYERLVSLPLWDEYNDLIKSDIADIKNSGGPVAGTITAAKFLQHFTNYPWIHFDIAAPAFLEKSDAYRLKGATGIHVRLMMKFISDLVKHIEK